MEQFPKFITRLAIYFSSILILPIIAIISAYNYRPSIWLFYIYLMITFCMDCVNLYQIIQNGRLVFFVSAFMGNYCIYRSSVLPHNLKLLVVFIVAFFSLKIIQLCVSLVKRKKQKLATDFFSSQVELYLVGAIMLDINAIYHFLPT